MLFSAFGRRLKDCGNGETIRIVVSDAALVLLQANLSQHELHEVVGYEVRHWFPFVSVSARWYVVGVEGWGLLCLFSCIRSSVVVRIVVSDVVLVLPCTNLWLHKLCGVVGYLVMRWFTIISISARVVPMYVRGQIVGQVNERLSQASHHFEREQHCGGVERSAIATNLSE